MQHIHQHPQEITQPTQIIILGGSGDLAKKKLIPALIDLYVHNKLPETFSVVGLARTPRTNQEYAQFVADALEEHEHGHSSETIQAFCSHFSYVSGSFDTTESYNALKTHIEAFDSEKGLCTNKLFYLAVPPQYYKTIFHNIHSSGLSETCSAGSWSRILVEKPFGSDLKTAQELEEILSSLFVEEQIFRIDHYLAKEAVQNLLSFRFANTLLRSPWNKDHIASVHITMHESIDIQGRGSFYDTVGALRDVGQNHLLQLLALIAMDEPKSFTPDDIRTQRVQILQQLQPVSSEDVRARVQRAQYEGYTTEKGVSSDSQTETFFRFTTTVQLPQWDGVPFYVEAGKALTERKVEIEVRFKDVASGPFETKDCHTIGNVVKLTLSPEQAMSITVNAKKPGHGYQLESQTLTFRCGATQGTEGIGAYEKVLLDCITGDQTLFTTTQEVLASWAFITSILNQWDSVPLQTYKKGSAGPEDIHTHK